MMNENSQKQSFLDSLPPFSVVLTMIILMVIGAGIIPMLDITQKPKPLQGANLAITFSWPKTSPITIEQEVTSKLEGMVSAVQGIQSVSSVSNLGSGRVNIQLKKGVNVAAVRFEISALIRQIHKKFHEDVSYPRVIGGSTGQSKTGLAASDPITLLSYRINADMDGEQLKEYVDLNIKPLIATLPDIEDVWVSGGIARYMDISYNPLILSNYGLTASILDDAIDSFMGRTNIVGDVVEHKDGDETRITVQLVTEMSNKEIADIPLTKINDKIIYLNDLATFEFKEREPTYFYRINGQSTINMSVTVDPEANIVSISEKLRKEIDQVKENLQGAVNLELYYDASEKVRIELYKLISRLSLSLIILLLFVWIVSRSGKYLSIISITLLANVMIAIIFYYLLEIQLHMFSLAGIAVSFGLIIDSTIVMVDHYSYYKNRKAFLAILAALLTTIGSLIIIFFMPDVIKNDLYDFARIIIVNLTVALFVALIFVPALVTTMHYNRRKQTIKSNQAAKVLVWSKFYSKFINFTQKKKWIYMWSLVLLFGIPISSLPGKWPRAHRDNAYKKSEIKETWYSELYNNTIGTDEYKENVAPILNKWLGGTMYLFSQNMGGRTFATEEQDVKLTIRGQIPQGGTAAQLNQKVMIIEQFLSKCEGISRFETRVGTWGAVITVEFDEDIMHGTLPYFIETSLISELINIGGADWSTRGVSDEGFSNSLNLANRSYRIMVHGFSYNQLYKYAEQIHERLNKNARVTDLAIENNSRAKAVEELYVDFDRQAITTNKTNVRATHNRLSEILTTRNLGWYNGDKLQTYLQLSSNKRDVFDLWNLENSYMRVGANEESLKYIGQIKKRTSKNSIPKSNQEYVISVAYNFLGERRLCDIMTNEIIEYFNETLPLGYRCSNKSSGYYRDKGDQYWLIFVIILIIFFMCSILFESIAQPLVIISLIPVSFIGTFLTFYFTGVNFGTGGFASLVLLSGLVVNAGIYIINEYNLICRSALPSQTDKVELYVKAYNHKIIPVFLTVLSTVLGLIPFLLDGPKEKFWFPFAIGTSGGLIFSVVALIFIMPIFMPLVKQEKKKKKKKRQVEI